VQRGSHSAELLVTQSKIVDLTAQGILFDGIQTQSNVFLCVKL